MKYDFNSIMDRHGKDAIAVDCLGLPNLPGAPREGFDAIPMWVADMDFESAPPVVKAIQERAAHPYFGYPYTQDLLKDHVIAHYKKKYGVTVRPEWIVWVPSVIPGVVAALQMMGGKSTTLKVQNAVATKLW